MIWLTMGLLLFTLAARSAEMPADGLYSTAQGPPSPQVQTQDGKTLILGTRSELDSAAQDNRLASNDNANTVYRLNLRISTDAPIIQNGYVLVVAGTVYRLQGWGTSVGRGTSQLTFHISGEDNARQVGEYLRLPLSLLSHPGYRLRTAFTPTRKSFARGDNITVTLRIVNVGPETVAFSTNPCEVVGEAKARGPWYKFSAYFNGRSIPDIGDTSTAFFCGGSTLGPSANILKPGAIYERTIELGKWFAFDQPGSYEILGSAMLNFVNAVSPNQRLPLTNLWTDYATADFNVLIE